MYKRTKRVKGKGGQVGPQMNVQREMHPVIKTDRQTKRQADRQIERINQESPYGPA